MTEEIEEEEFESLIALKDHLIVQNDYRREIQKGDALDDIPERFHETLKTEQII